MSGFKVLIALIILIVGIAGYFACAASSIIGIGYALYLFAHGTAVGMALWQGFCAFLFAIFGGLVAVFLAWVFSKLID